MDESFEEWVKGSTQHPCMKRWGEELIELGISWDSFRREPDSLVKDLVTGGVPLLAARDIVTIAAETIQRSNAPMAIFWDLENMPIPLECSGRDVTSRLKSILAPHGNLVQFRGYASIGLGLIPQQKRSDLQLSGCHLVDCPHNGRKEVADKMIIVDAMQFAFMNPDGATLCFITGDVDYAYLLAVLQRPQWRTIVISKGTLQSMLHVNCDMKMRWETDILQLRPAVVSPPPRLPPGEEESEDESEEESEEESSIAGPDVAEWDDSTSFSTERESSFEDVNRKATQLRTTTANTTRAESSAVVVVAAAATPAEPTTNDKVVGNDSAASSISEQQPPCEFLTPDEEWTNNVELLRNILKTTGTYASPDPGYTTLKSLVGGKLRETNPARFSNRDMVRNFLARSIEMGVVIESGEGGKKMLRLPISRQVSSSGLGEVNSAGPGPGSGSVEAVQPQRPRPTSYAAVGAAAAAAAATTTAVPTVDRGESHGSTFTTSEQQSPFEFLTADEQWTDDVELLRTILKTMGSYSSSQDLACTTLKSLVGHKLRQTNPARFSDRDTVRNFLARSIEAGVVKESGEGCKKMLSLPIGTSPTVRPAISLSDQVPMNLKDIPDKVWEQSGLRPYVLFAPWHLFPPSTQIPKRAFVQSSGKWAILLFRTLTDAQRTVAEELPQLRMGFLVDWRRAGPEMVAATTTK